MKSRSPLPILELLPLYAEARASAKLLRNWTKQRYRLRDGQLPIAVALTLPQLAGAIQHHRYYGYDISQSPSDFREAITTYLEALRQGRTRRSITELPPSCLNAHRLVVRAMDKANKTAPSAENGASNVE